MAKGKIEKLASAWQDNETTWEFSRHDTSISLKAIELERGEGKYLGLQVDEDTWERLPAITARSVEQANDEVMGPQAFRSKVVSLFNSTIFRPLWRASVEGYKIDAVLTDSDKETILKKFETALNDEFNAEPGQFGRPKDASYYSRQATKEKEKLAPYLKLKQEKKTLTPAQIEEIKKITAEYQRLVATAEEMRLAEDAKAKADEDGLLALLGESEPDVNPIK